MPKFYNTESWESRPYLNTTGTRDKEILVHPKTGDLYYFKSSLITEGRNYKYEFWSEIIAYKIGQLLNMDILEYDIALRGGHIGCISKSMVKEGESSLIEGVRYLSGYYPGFDPETRAGRKEYDYQLIMDSLETYSLQKFKINIISIIIFDSIIGNGDRHQENWAVILSDETYNKVGNNILFKIFCFFQKKIKSDYLKKNLKLLLVDKFAPIYDSGSCLGRELDENKIELFLNDDDQLQRYVLKGKSEIHWEKKKISHFSLIKNILKLSEGEVKLIINKIIDRWDENQIEEIIYSIDKELPEEWSEYRMSDNRKKLIIKLLNLRFKLIKEIVR